MDIMENDVLLFKALADETRLKIVKLLADGELCACELLTYFQITQPTLSYHMKILTDCGVVSGHRDGSWMRYQLDSKGLSMMQDFLVALLEKEVPKLSPVEMSVQCQHTLDEEILS